jgi:hypothetical protein
MTMLSCFRKERGRLGRLGRYGGLRVVRGIARVGLQRRWYRYDGLKYEKPAPEGRPAPMSERGNGRFIRDGDSVDDWCCCRRSSHTKLVPVTRTRQTLSIESISSVFRCIQFPFIPAAELTCRIEYLGQYHP